MVIESPLTLDQIRALALFDGASRQREADLAWLEAEAEKHKRDSDARWGLNQAVTNLEDAPFIVPAPVCGECGRIFCEHLSKVAQRQPAEWHEHFATLADPITAVPTSEQQLAAAVPVGKRTPWIARCTDCDLPYSDDGWADFVVADEVWKRITQEDDAPLLCAVCMTRRATRVGFENMAGAFTSGPFAQDNWTKPVDIPKCPKCGAIFCGHLSESARKDSVPELPTDEPLATLFAFIRADGIIFAAETLDELPRQAQQKANAYTEYTFAVETYRRLVMERNGALHRLAEERAEWQRGDDAEARGRKAAFAEAKAVCQAVADKIIAQNTAAQDIKAGVLMAIAALAEKEG